MIVDAHFHQWCLARGDYGWLTPDDAALYRDFCLADWYEQRGEVAAGILVQAAPTVEETQYLLGIAHSAQDVLGVVGWTDLEDEGAPAALSRLAATPKLCAIRPMIQDIADPDWMLRPTVITSLREAARLGLRLDALVLPHHLPRLYRLCQQIPQLAVIVDHGAKPQIRDEQRDQWQRDMAELASLPQVYCKFSGLLTEAAPGAGYNQLKPYVDTLLESFGPRRLLWGSDWPVVTLREPYGRWLELSRRLLSDLSGAEQAAVFGGNALCFYGLPVHGPTAESGGVEA